MKTNSNNFGYFFKKHDTDAQKSINYAKMALIRVVRSPFTTAKQRDAALDLYDSFREKDPTNGPFLESYAIAEPLEREQPRMHMD